ncbi:MAG: tripartite tricarboxylate transporter substrate binding protein [Betaproteobacteria bacterium]|nr:tripartite tricarboxylate transporter substrate binding protein [Betaproteobacteria bacterium]
MRFYKLLTLLGGVPLAASMLAPAIVAAQGYPSKPVRVLIGQPPGGVQDILARTMSAELAKVWGQPVTLDNRVGGTGVVAALAAARAAPDGYTIFFSTAANMNTAQFLQTDLPYHPEKDFIPVVALAQGQSILLAGNHVGVNSTRELIEKAKANPGKLNYGTFGVASSSHFDTEALAKENGFKAVHVPYKGAVEVMNGLIGAHVDFAITALVAAIPLVNSGKIKGLGYTGEKRTGALPQVPTLHEQGYGFFETGGLFAFYLQTGAPPEVMDKIASDTSRIRGSPFFLKNIIAANGMEDLPLQGAALVTRFQKAREDFASRIKGLDLQLR